MSNLTIAQSIAIWAIEQGYVGIELHNGQISCINIRDGRTYGIRILDKPNKDDIQVGKLTGDQWDGLLGFVNPADPNMFDRLKEFLNEINPQV